MHLYKKQQKTAKQFGLEHQTRQIAHNYYTQLRIQTQLVLLVTRDPTLERRTQISNLLYFIFKGRSLGCIT
jgi:hypothetical protein